MFGLHFLTLRIKLLTSYKSFEAVHKRILMTRDTFMNVDTVVSTAEDSHYRALLESLV